MKLSPQSVSSAKLLLSAVTVLRLLLRDGWKELEGHLDRRRNGEQWMVVEKQIMPLLGKLMDKNENILFSKVKYKNGQLHAVCLCYKGGDTGSCWSAGYKLF